MRLDGRKEIQSVKSTWSIWIRSVKDAIKDAIIKDAKQTYTYTHHAKSKPYRSKETARELKSFFITVASVLYIIKVGNINKKQAQLEETLLLNVRTGYKFFNKNRFKMLHFNTHIHIVFKLWLFDEFFQLP